MKSDFKERAWSLLDNKPLFLYSKQFDTYVVIWAGEVMTREEAIYSIIACRTGFGPSQAMKMTNFQNYLDLLKTGLLERYTDELNIGWSLTDIKHVDEDNHSAKKSGLANGRTREINKLVYRKLRENFDETSLTDILKMFEYDKAIEDD